MIELTYNNHLKFGYNNQYWISGDQQKDQLIFEYGSCKETTDIKSEYIRAAQLIANRAKDDLVLCLSGGIDSEVMVRIFIDAKIKFKIAIMRFENDLNLYDIKYGISFCQKFDLEYSFFDLDVIKFHEEEEFKHYSDEAQCGSPQLSCILWLMDQLKDSFAVMAGQFPVIYNSNEGVSDFINYQIDNNYDFIFINDSIRADHKDYNPPFVQLMPDTDVSIFRWLMKKNNQAVPQFYHYTPEMTMAYFQHPATIDYINQIGLFENNKVWNYNVKRKLYDSFFSYDMEHRPGATGGFEDVKQMFKTKNIQYDAVFRLPLMKKYPNVMDRAIIPLLSYLPM